MERESFTFINTMRDIKTGSDIIKRYQDLRTSSKRFRAKQLIPKVDENVLAIALEQEKRRFMRQNQSIERSKKKVGHARAKLLATFEKNRRIMELRQKLQKDRWIEWKPKPENI